MGIPRQITRDGTIVIDEEELTGADVVEIMRSRDVYCGWSRDKDKRIAEIEAALRDVSNVKAAVEIMDDAENAAAEYSAALNRARAIARRALEKA